MSEEYKQKWIGKNNPMYGKTKEKSPRYGIKHTEETKLKISNTKRLKKMEQI